MALTTSTPKKLGTEAPDFSLMNVDGKRYSLASFKDSQALVVIFMCNHCPYVVATQGRINALAKAFGPRGVALLGINSNDSVKYPEDSFEEMKVRAKEQAFLFPYLHDGSQAVAKAYGAVCTPDPFVFENTQGKFLLRYQGRIDDNWKDETKVMKRDLADALESILSGRAIPTDQKPAMGCSIKWR